MHSVIVGGGPIENPELFRALLNEADEIVCADGGLMYLDQLGINPNIIIGDFDSVDLNILSKYRLKGIKTEKFPARKDATDSELTMDYVIKSKAKKVSLIGMTGKRLDHGLANIFMLRKFFDEKIDAVILDGHNQVYYGRGNISLKGEVGALLSIIPITHEVKGVKTSGLDYPLNEETLYNDRSRGVSNIIRSNEIQINTVSGDFLIILSRD